MNGQGNLLYDAIYNDKETVEKNLKEMSEIITGVSNIFLKYIDSTDKRFTGIDGRFDKIEGLLKLVCDEINKFKEGAQAPSTLQVASPQLTAPATASAPKLAPQPLNPVSARAALQGELKALFAKRKQE